MKAHIATVIIALIAGCLGGISSQYFQSQSISTTRIQEKHNADLSSRIQVDTEVEELILQIAQLQQKTDWLETQLYEVANHQATVQDSTLNSTARSAEQDTRKKRTLVPDRDDLIFAGVNPDMADDILRRISQQAFRRLELQNLIQRNASLDARQYREELRELNQNRISLRTELGDDIYDHYLAASGQNNRVKVTSVMAESPAELNGIQTGDVILYYDDQKIFATSDLRKASLGGEIGSYTNVVISRDAMRMSLIMPRGILGVQLEAIQTDPASEHR